MALAGLLDAGEVGGEVVAVVGVAVVGVSVVAGHAGVGLVLGDAVEVHDAVVQVDVVAGMPMQRLTRRRSGVSGCGLRKTMMSPRRGVAVVDKGAQCEGGAREMRSTRTWSPMSRVFSMEAGGNLEVLEDERHDEEADREHGADGGERFERGLALFVLAAVAVLSSGVMTVLSDRSKSPHGS